MTEPEDDRSRASRSGAAAGAKTPSGSGPLDQELTGALTPPGAALAASQPTFAVGEVLAERFRIVRFLAEGGMGEVYEADDLHLQERVALKTVRPGIAEDPRALERFRREIQLARKVTHPNVCRVFDVFHHRVTAGGRERQIAFISMELLAGETLAQRLRRRGRLAPAEALPIARQMAAALDAAHQAGVIHRDFKPGNVVLVEDDKGLRAVVTDFGLARHQAGEPSASEAPSATGLVLGTAAYMAPEQVEGGQVSPATDIYALGITLYEMVTGRLPFVAESSLSAAVKRLKEAPAPPASHVPDLPPAWNRAILRCLEQSPAHRFRSGVEVARALEGRPGPPAIPGRLAALAALGAAALAAILLLRPSRAIEPKAPAAAVPLAPVTKPRPAVALLGFKNLSGRPDAAWLSVALAEMLGTELSAGESLRTIPGEDVARVKSEMALADADGLSRDTLGRLRKSLGADRVVLGSYLALGGQIRLDLRVQDAVAGETLGSVSQTGTEAGLLDLVSKAGSQLRETLGAGGLSKAQQAAARASRPSSPEAARLYSEGLARLRLYDAQGARERLARSIAADPAQPLAHSALAAAWAQLGYDQRAREEARRARELATGLGREERLSIEGREHEANGDWTKAVEAYRLLWGFFPDDLDYGLRLAGVQTTAGKGEGALATVEALRTLPAPSGDDPRVDLAEAQAADSLSDFRRSQSAAARAAAKAESGGARQLVARATLELGTAYWGMGETERAAAAFGRARAMFAEAGDQLGVALALNRSAGVPYERGDLRAAKKMFEESLAISRSIGDQRGVGRQLGNVAEALYNLGDLTGAKRLYQEAMAVNRELGAKSHLSDNQSGMGNVLVAQGDLRGALQAYQDALALAREVGDRRFAGYALHGLGEALRLQGDLGAARQRHQEALALRQEMGQKDTMVASRLALAEVALEEGRPAEAEPYARDAAQEFARERFTDYQAAALKALARALVDQGPTPARIADAHRAMDEALALSRSSQKPQVRLGIAVAAARLAARTGEAASAAPRLEALLREASEAGLVSLQLEATLALGQAEVAAGLPAGRPRLAALAKDAAARGFGLVARQAANLPRSGAAAAR